MPEIIYNPDDLLVNIRTKVTRRRERMRQAVCAYVAFASVVGTVTLVWVATHILF